MKVHRLELRNYKQFRDISLDFTDDFGKPNDLIVLIGDNGKGKSSILQAIAATIMTATFQVASPSELNWPGWMFPTLSSNHDGFASVDVDVQFTEDELQATREYFRQSDFSKREYAVEPSLVQDVTLTMTNDPQAKYPISAPDSHRFFQFQGRNYARNVLFNYKNVPDIFKRVGALFYYHEQRTANSLMSFGDERKDDLTQERIRNWFAYQNGKIERFNSLYSRLFLGRKLSRPNDLFDDQPPPILFADRDSREYLLNELSGGERALLPILLDFIQWDINNSIILIDEVELHLHPPLQQLFVATLPTLGMNNQFILTTHSDNVFDIIPESSIRRMSQINNMAEVQ